MSKKSINSTVKVVAILVGAIIVVVLALGLLPMITEKPVTNSELNKIAATYAKSRCHTDVKKESKDDKFCDNLKVIIGDKEEDADAVAWNVTVRRGDTEGAGSRRQVPEVICNVHDD